MMEKRMPRMTRIRTDFESPSARPFPPQAEKIRFYLWYPWHPFFHHVAFSKKRRSLNSAKHINIVLVKLKQQSCKMRDITFHCS
jgi:hypothetical protein